MSNIIESVELYPRKYLFINSKNEPYQEKSVQKMFYDLVPNKNLGINAFRSIYISYYFKKLNKLQLERIAAFMRTSVATMQNSYFKADDQADTSHTGTSKPDSDTNKYSPSNPVKTITPEQKELRDKTRAAYQQSYYEGRRAEILEKAKANDKAKYYLRYCRELNSGLLDIKQVKKETTEKYKIKYNEETKQYYSVLAQ